ncbi:MAG: hypothetical protein ACOYYU_09465 [Chloroflexota bacterium]
MASNNQFTRKQVSFFSTIFFMLVSALYVPLPAQAQGHAEGLALDFPAFVMSVQDGQAGVLRGVYAPDVLAMPVVQQPTGWPGYVSETADVVTQFGMAAEVGNVGLLAHNYLAGQAFTGLLPGQEVRLVYGDGRVEYFIVTEVLRYQALQPYSPTSEFRNLETSLTITVEELFRQVYRGERHVTFQTCIEANGNSSWGRLFVIAQPRSAVFEAQRFLRSETFSYYY